MAKRFTGKFSPQATPGSASEPPPRTAAPGKPTPRRRIKAGWRAAFLFIAPFPFIFRAFFQDPAGLAQALGAYGLLILAAWLTREGIIAQKAFEERAVARRPAIPRKMFGSVVIGAGLALGTFDPSGNILNPLIIGAVGTILHFLSFGADPLKDKVTDGFDTFQSDRVARAVEEAERHLADMTAAIERSGDRNLIARVASFEDNVRALFKTVENDPRRLTAARRYLGVYLLGARDATVKFSELIIRRRDTTAKAGYVAFLDDLEANFAARTEALLSDDRQALDIEMSVLRERLQREGLRSD